MHGKYSLLIGQAVAPKVVEVEATNVKCGYVALSDKVEGYSRHSAGAEFLRNHEWGTEGNKGIWRRAWKKHHGE